MMETECTSGCHQFIQTIATADPGSQYCYRTVRVPLKLNSHSYLLLILTLYIYTETSCGLSRSGSEDRSSWILPPCWQRTCSDTLSYLSQPLADPGMLARRSSGILLPKTCLSCVSHAWVSGGWVWNSSSVSHQGSVRPGGEVHTAFFN